MATTTAPSIALILCSQRTPRVCPQIGTFVLSTITATNAAATIKVIDLAEWNLPLFNEPTIPSEIHDPSAYGQPHTRAWSAEISKYSGFIFVTPQYNWGYPAAVKNAIDYLFNEWKGKSSMIVSYGGHGGGKGALQLKQVLNGVRMKVAETMPALTFASRQALVCASKGEDIGLGAEGSGVWEAEKEVIAKAFGELVVLLQESKA